ncbi:uncharacterized protein J4E87_008493 [Alternaria ethzedia]|uniref:uncharacterized protein n=1 Tax=Alternaria ethzedia TaxID=181014 RepID=UPI0020C5569D|nr:uncharacterized protein J4E87_008493 [Alternaria ethzedia]KAI4616981.1 hypothetical protein J4E87_008493 [Alternaria ethzedia]
MSAQPPTKAPERLPPTLSEIYRTYKQGTSIVISWLVSLDSSATTKPRPNQEQQDQSHAAGLTVREIADRARQAASMGKKPPVDIQAAFKNVILNRSKLTRYYEALPSSTQEVQDSTERHKVFNETLAEAYALLMPKVRQKKRATKGAPSASSDAFPPATTNSFEALIGLIEAEKDHDGSVSQYWQDSLPRTSPKRSAIVEDPIEDAIAIQTHLTEYQAIVDTTNAIWRSFARGDTSLAAAGWLTNMAQHFVRGLKCHASKDVTIQQGVFSEIGDCGSLRLDITAEELTSTKFSESVTSSSFVELTHGTGLIWPFRLLNAFVETKQIPRSFENERRRFQDFFRNPSEERSVKENFVGAVAEFASRDGSQLSQEDRQAAGEKICADRYDYERMLLGSIVKSISLHPAYQAYQLDPDSNKAQNASPRWAYIRQGHLQHPSALPLVAESSKKVTWFSELVATHMLLESGRSFLHECERLGKTPPNCRIILLSRANEVLRAIAELQQHQNLTGDTIELLKMNLEKFLAVKTFDIYSQSPWVTGSYMSAISDFTLYCGLAVLNEQKMFAAVMHLYNMLRQIDARCPQIPVLEHLQSLFKTVVFPGKQEPREKFLNTFEIYCGARFVKKLTKDFTELTTTPKKVPQQVAGEQNKIRFSTMELSAQDSFHNVYIPTPELWVKLTGDPNVIRRIERDKGKTDIQTSYPPSELIRRAQEIIRPEYEGAFAIARLNCFAVYGLCQDILFEIATRFGECGPTLFDPLTHALDSCGYLEIHSDSIDSALLCVRLTMSDVDLNLRGRNDRMADKRFHEIRSVAMTRDAIVKVCKGRKVEDFLWQNY